MDVSEAKQKKAELERAIVQLVEQFNEETGMTVQDINIRYASRVSIGTYESGIRLIVETVVLL